MYRYEAALCPCWWNELLLLLKLPLAIAVTLMVMRKPSRPTQVVRTSSARKQVLDLRIRLQPFLDADPVAHEHADAINLHRHIVARQGDLDAAAEMFRSSHEWRRSPEVDLDALKAR